MVVGQQAALVTRRQLWQCTAAPQPCAEAVFTGGRSDGSDAVKVRGQGRQAVVGGAGRSLQHNCHHCYLHPDCPHLQVCAADTGPLQLALGRLECPERALFSSTCSLAVWAQPGSDRGLLCLQSEGLRSS